MRTWKHFTFAAILAIIALTACDNSNGRNDPSEQPIFRTTTINLFEGNTAIVQGTLLEAQWNNTPNKIETAINDAFENLVGIQKTRFRVVFGEDVTIIVENTTNYFSYNVYDGKTLKLNIDYLSVVSKEDLELDISKSIDEMRTIILYVAPVTANPPAGTYSEPLFITLNCATQGAPIYYTLDGTEKFTSGILYENPIPINSNTVLKAIAAHPKYSGYGGGYLTAEYIIE